MAKNKCPQCGHEMFTQTFSTTEVLDFIVDKPGKQIRLGNMECGKCGTHIFIKCKILGVIREA